MELSIAYLNDVHGYLEPHSELFYEGGEEIVETVGGYARIASMVKDIRDKNRHTLLFDGGDTFHGTLPLIKSKGEVIIPILNKMGFSAMVGHWDFAYGPEQLKKIAGELNYPILGINVYKEDGTLFLPPYIITQVDNLKIAIIGICSNIIDKTMPKNFSQGLKISDGLKELPLIIQQAKEEGANFIILLSHNGFPQDMDLLSKVSGIDVCLSAHTHNRLYEPLKVNGAIIIQCGCHGSFLGHLKLNIEQNKIVDLSYELSIVDKNLKTDPEIENLVKDIMEPYQYLKREVLGRTESILHRYNTIASSADDLLLLAIKSAGNTDLAFSNGWRYGAPISAGEITTWDLYNMMPMNPVVSTIELSGNEIIQMLEENLERVFAVEAMEQMGGYIKRCLGLNVKMRVENPKNHRIQQIFIGDKPLIKDQIYKAAFVTMQSVPEKFGMNRQDLSIKVIESITEYLVKNPNYKAESYNTFSLI